MKNEQGFTLNELITALFFIVLFGLISWVGYVVIHFINKWW